MATSTPNPVGPFGVPGGVQFDDGTYSSITNLKIRFEEGFVSIQTTYTNSDGQIIVSPVHGSILGGTSVSVNLADGEYLTSLSGHYHTDGPNPAVHSLAFQSNTKPYGPYGTTPNGIPFSTPKNETGKIVGFFGASDEYLNSIGAYFEPIKS